MMPPGGPGTVREARPASRLERQPCDVCDGREVAVIGRPRVAARARTFLADHADVRVVRCRRCGFYFADPMPLFSDADAQALYADDYFSGISVGTPWWEHVRRVANPTRRLERLTALAHTPIVDFLEIGCGEGLAMEQAIQRGWKVRGQDLSTAAAEALRRRLGVPVVAGPLEARPFGDEQFDAVYLDSVLEHVPHPRVLLGELHRLLRPRGLAYVIVPNEASLLNGIRQSWHRVRRTGRAPQLAPLEPPYHLVGFTPTSLARLAERAGFRVRHLEVRDGSEQRKKYTRRQRRPYAIHTAFLPFSWLGERLGRGVSIEAVLES